MTATSDTRAAHLATTPAERVTQAATQTASLASRQPICREADARTGVLQASIGQDLSANNAMRPATTVVDLLKLNVLLATKVLLLLLELAAEVLVELEALAVLVVELEEQAELEVLVVELAVQEELAELEELVELAELEELVELVELVELEVLEEQEALVVPEAEAAIQDTIGTDQTVKVATIHAHLATDQVHPTANLAIQTQATTTEFATALQATT